MRLRERIRIEAAVQRVGWWLDWGHLAGRRRREVVKELRAGLADAAAAGELDEALARLGRPREVAEAYLEHERTGVRWRAGAVAAACALLAVSWLGIAFMFGFSEGVRAVGAEAGEVYEVGRGLVVGDHPLTTYREDDGTFMTSQALFTWPHLVGALVAFVAFARPWRALRRRRVAPQHT